MEDINFNKFVCYILNCIGATENNKLTILYSDKILKKVPYNGDNSKINFKKLNYTYKDDAAVNAAGGAGVVDLADVDISYTILNGDTSEIRKYFNIKEVASYVTNEANANQLNVSKSIFKAFNMIKVFFDAKNWYLQQYRNLQNQLSNSKFNFDHNESMYGGFNIKYDNTNENVTDDASYNKFLGNVLKDFIYMITNNTDKIANFDVTTLYVLSKINYYLAKRYAVLSIKNNPDEFYEALNQYSKISAFNNSFFNNFTYYTKEIDDKNYPRYYQREILKLLNVGRLTEDDKDVLSYFLVKENNLDISNMTDDTSLNNIIAFNNYSTQYKSYFENNIQYINTYINFVSDYELINKIRNCIVDISQNRQDIVKDVVSAAAAAASAAADADAVTVATNTAITQYRNNFNTVINKYDFSRNNNEIKNTIKIVAAAAADAARAAAVDAAGAAHAGDDIVAARANNAAAVAAAGAVDAAAARAADNAIDNAIAAAVGAVAAGPAYNDYIKIDVYIRNIIIAYIKKIIQGADNIKTSIDTNECITLNIKDEINNNIIKKINEIKKYYIPMFFKTIKPYIKKYSNNTFSSVYQSPTFTYSVTPINIRPLVYKRATETDLSNYAAQIASDSFINNNQLPTIPDFKSIDKVIGLLGGAPDINNSSNVYRTIFNKILNALNAKRIKLNDDDRDKVNTKLNDLEEIEQYLKSTLSDYAKYASVTHQKGTMVGYNDVKDFLNDYENKLREYNKKSASVVRFIGRLTPYLYSY